MPRGCGTNARCSARGRFPVVPWEYLPAPPNHIDIDIDVEAGVVRQLETEYGTTVHIPDDTPYCITIQNGRKRYPDAHPDDPKSATQRIAVEIYIDGRKVSPTPILIGKKRSIKGFAHERTTTEDVREEKHDYTIEKIMEPFVAHATITASSRSRPVNPEIGDIKFDFFATKQRRMQPGRRSRNHGNPLEPQQPQPSREGVMQTSSDDRFTEKGKHHGGGSAPVIDRQERLGSCKITICNESKLLTLGEYM